MLFASTTVSICLKTKFARERLSSIFSQGCKKNQGCKQSPFDQHFFQVYFISKGQIKPVRQNGFSCIKHDYEIHLNSSSILYQVEDFDDIPQVQLNPTSISKLPGIPKGELVNILGVIINVGECCEIKLKNGDSTSKRVITLVDR